MLYISQLKLRNFKSFSFANISLPKSFLCLAGPNGSGKSNLTDAIRFALGETSLRSLRARKVKDLIHTGSTTAEVTLSFDGIKKYEIKRAIRSDGKILYKLNGKKTTRSAIQDEMKKYNLDESGRNVIAQGQVQRIIDMSGKERRTIIESVAGISDFEEKKKEAMKELDIVDTRIRESNLVLGEREAFVAELEKEKYAALQYLESKKHLTNSRASLITYEAKRLDELLEGVNKDEQKLKFSISKREQELAEVDGKIAEVEKSRSSTSAELQLRQQTSQLVKKIEELRSSTTSRQQMIADREMFLNKLNEEHQALKKEIENEKTTLSALEKELESLKSGLKAAEIEKSQFAGSATNDEIEGFRAKIKELEKKLSSSKENSIRLEADAKSKSELINAKAEQIASLNVESIEGKKEDMLGKLSKLKGYSKDASDEIDDCFRQTREFNAEISEIDKKTLELKEQTSLLRFKVSPALQNPALKFVSDIREKKAVKGIHGTVVDLIKFDTKFTAAIEAAGGGRLLYTIVDDLDTASQIIEKLKAAKVGRATFIPLKEVRTSEKKQVKGAVPLIDFIDYDEALHKAVAYIFGDTFLVNSMQDAKKLAGTARIVTLDGELLEHSGIVTGGKNESSVLLSTKLKKLDSEISDLKSRKEELVKELYATREHESSLRAKKTQFEIEIKTVEMEIRNEEEKHAEEGEKLKKKGELAKEIEEIKGIIRNSQKEKERELEEIKSFEKKMAEINAQLEASENKARQLSDAMAKKKLEITARVSSLQATFEGKQKELEIRKNEFFSREERVKGMEKERKELVNAINEHKRQISKDSEELVSLEANVKKYSKEIEKLFEVMKKCELELQELGRVRGERRIEADKLSKELNQVAVKKATSEAHLQDMKAELSNFKEFELLKLEKDELTKMRKDAEEKLAALGNVNLAAIEMYEKKKEEIRDIRERIDKLASERDSVLGMINGIEERKKEAFFETYNSVNENFKKMFSYLTIGEGYLSLDNPSEPFESGMHIKLKRGTTEHALGSLSGGESSLVALMFIFALQFFKSSPFYILDEVDAALDKENSKNLAKLIKEIAKDTQFLVVSHNDMVMSSAEAVLGVTRVDGSSKIVGVKLESIATT